MATPTRGKKERPFPALVIASLLFAACLFPGQRLIANLLPGISGLATINPGLVIFDIPVHLPVTIDLILVPALFFLIYTVVILLYPSRRSVTTWRETFPRLGAVLAGSSIFLFAAAAGGILSYFVQDYLPRNVRNGIDSLGITADISLPFSAYKMIHLPGNIITLIGLIIGLAICIAKISKTPGVRKVAPLTREQRMTPYERMQKEKRMEKETTSPVSRPPAKAKTETRQPAAPRKPAETRVASIQPITTNKNSSRPKCQNHPMMTLEPEAVGYMPMR